MYSYLLGAVMAVASGPVGTAQDRAPLKDFTDTKLEDLGIKPVEPKKDSKTGFIVGAKNPTPLIKGLTEINSQTIAAIEQGRYSPSLDVAFRIAHVFGKRVDEVFHWRPDGTDEAGAPTPSGP